MNLAFKSVQNNAFKIVNHTSYWTIETNASLDFEKVSMMYDEYN